MVGRRVLPVSWTDLLEAYQWHVLCDPSTHPCLDLQSGQVTCPAVQGLRDVDDAEGRLAPMPLEDPMSAFQARARFLETVCDKALRAGLSGALAGPRPFKVFDEVLFEVPVEETRWREEKRIGDLQLIDAWLGRLGIDPEPAPDLTRTVIAFPRRRE